MFNLRGNQRTSGELSRKEGGKIFGSGSRTPISITILVRKPNHAGSAAIHYEAVADYLSQYSVIQRIELLPYHTMGRFKYENLGIKYPLEGVKDLTDEELKHAQTFFN